MYARPHVLIAWQAVRSALYLLGCKYSSKLQSSFQFLALYLSSTIRCELASIVDNGKIFSDYLILRFRLPFLEFSILLL